MRRLAAILIAATLLTAPSAGAAALKPNGVVSAQQVVLSDLFDGLPPEQAARVVTNAPAPGGTLTLDTATLLRIATANGVAWRPVGLGEMVQLKREAVQIPQVTIQDGLRDALVQQAGTSANVDILLDNRSLALFLPVGSDTSVRVENLAYDPVRGRLTADLIAPATGPQLLRQTVSGRAIDMVELPVLNRRLAPGEVVGDSDLSYLNMPRDRVVAGAITSAGELVGKSLRRAVAPNQPVNGRDVREPVVVVKGQVVTILLQSGSMQLSAQGKALSDGAQGELVRIVNSSSSRVIEATVAGPNLVTVRPAAQIAAAQQAAARIAANPARPSR
ncbi:flagellar basal body P-ring formation protein FlgA [Niveispirillum sp. SYP-B3756]|uniref:flagellar basal body P-ring formation chaperone FlgA n=1 Tax=Niveispirillum sp. SYP-B3756 TaxID=2662178 RepID=UPI0012909B90|nr:flagellar basal body P-ring formation chaperone FlgA [Niveispirillum sp. SYP-B3756]MQP66469.1 flagellar basal body P-ring formation protein FlgA [Niveispirillum sp. SYP-B3756]